MIRNPQGLWSCLIKVFLPVIHPDKIFQFAQRGGEGLEIRLPLGHTVSIHLDDSDRCITDGLRFLKNPDLSPLNKAAVVGVQAEMHQIFGKRCVRQILITDRNRPCGHVQPRFKFQAVVLELDLGLIKGYVNAALHIGTAFSRIFQRLTVHSDAHVIQSKRINRFNLAGQRGDIDPLVIVEDDRFIVDNLHLDLSRIGFYKSSVHHVV